MHIHTQTTLTNKSVVCVCMCNKHYIRHISIIYISTFKLWVITCWCGKYPANVFSSFWMCFHIHQLSVSVWFFLQKTFFKAELKKQPKYNSGPFTRTISKHWCKWVCVVLLTFLIMKPERLIIQIITPSNHFLHPAAFSAVCVCCVKRLVYETCEACAARLQVTVGSLGKTNLILSPWPFLQSEKVIWLWMDRGGVIDGFKCNMVEEQSRTEEEWWGARPGDEGFSAWCVWMNWMNSRLVIWGFHLLKFSILGFHSFVQFLSTSSAICQMQLFTNSPSPFSIFSSPLVPSLLLTFSQVPSVQGSLLQSPALFYFLSFFSSTHAVTIPDWFCVNYSCVIDFSKAQR